MLGMFQMPCQKTCQHNFDDSSRYDKGSINMSYGQMTADGHDMTLGLVTLSSTAKMLHIILHIPSMLQQCTSGMFILQDNKRPRGLDTLLELKT